MMVHCTRTYPRSYATRCAEVVDDAALCPRGGGSSPESLAALSSGF